MKTLVCLKQILDPEIPQRDFRIDSTRREAARGSARLVTNIFCENALETALQLRERSGGEVRAISIGPPSAEETLRKALALKADQAGLVAYGDDLPRLNSAVAACLLAAAIRHWGPFDLILTGREAGDWGAGQTGGLLAEELGLPLVAFVDHIETAGEGILLRRQTEGGWDRVEAALPLVATITNSDENVPRIPKTRDIMMSQRQPLARWTPNDLGVPAERLSAAADSVQVVDLSIPQRQSRCEFIEGESLDERIEAFAARIAEIVSTAG